MPFARARNALALLAFVTDCSIHLGPLEMSIGSGGSSGSWGGGTTGTSSDQAEGQVNYRIAHLTHNDTVFLVIVFDGTGGVTSHHGGSPSGGEVGTLDGRTIIWECHTTDAKTGTVTIAGTDFLLENGGLFLVSARHGKTWVRQAACDLTTIRGSVDLAAVQAAAGNDPLSTDFLRRIEVPRPTSRGISSNPFSQ